MNQMSNTPRLAKLRPTPLEPTAERQSHGEVVQADRPIKVETGEFARPHIAVDILDRLFADGKINRDEWTAGDRFRAWFRLAHLDELRASDFARPYVDGRGAGPSIGYRAEFARGEISKAIRWVGGDRWEETRVVNCLWHVIGLERSFRDMPKQVFDDERIIPRHNASGLLVAALERLATMPWRGPFEEHT
jgi:hypothetical protein